MPNPQQLIEGQIADAMAAEKSLADLEAELMANETFKQFLEMQKTVPKKLDEIWRGIEQQMIEHDIKSVKGDWGSITIAERINWDYDPTMLPPKFFKKVVDTKKLTDTFRLEGKEPKGATARYSKYLTKRLK